MISKQAVLDAILKSGISANHYSLLKKLINDIPSISDGWISVEDVLPEIKDESGDFKKVLVCWGENMQSNSATMNYVCRFIHGKHVKRFEYHLRTSPFKVTHWRELPPAPTK